MTKDTSCSNCGSTNIILNYSGDDVPVVECKNCGCVTNEVYMEDGS